MAVGMIKTINKNRLVLLPAIFMMMGAAGGNMQSKDLWHFISEMSVAVKKISIQRLDSAPLSFSLTDSNEYINFYRARRLTLADSTHIDEIELRLSKAQGEMAPLMSFQPQGQCIALTEIQKHYPKLSLTDYPRGKSENEVTSYTTAADANGQVITFSFRAIKPDCLSQVVITAEE